MAKKETKDGWTIQGINLISSDALYQQIHGLIQAGDLNPAHLCGAAGHLGPIDVDPDTKVVNFRSF